MNVLADTDNGRQAGRHAGIQRKEGSKICWAVVLVSVSRLGASVDPCRLPKYRGWNLVLSDSDFAPVGVGVMLLLCHFYRVDI